MQEDSKILLDKVAKNLSNEKISNNKDKKSFGDDHGEYGKFYLPRRFILAVLLFGVCMLMNCQRSCLSVAIVAMSSDTKYWDDGKWKIQEAEFDWDSEKKGMLLGAFFYGFFFSQIPTGWLCMKFGGKAVLMFSMFSASTIHVLLPLIVRISDDYFFASRVLQGLCLGLILPANHYMWGKWAPTSEKSRLVSASISGLSAGMLTAYPVSGMLSQYGFAGGWPSVFYVVGIAGYVWCFAWYVLAAESPLDHRTISKAELALMDQLTKPVANPKIPWCKILQSKAVLAVIIANFTFDWSYYTLLICMPLFLRDVHKYTIAATGMLSALPWLCMTIMISVCGYIADAMRRCISVGLTRKLCFNVGIGFSGILLIISGYTISSTGTIVMLCGSVGFFGFAFSGFMVNPMDLSPTYGSTIIGISNSLAAVTGFIGPGMVGLMTKDGTSKQWIEVFYLLAGVSGIGGILYAVLASGEKQPWSEDCEETDVLLEEGKEVKD